MAARELVDINEAGRITGLQKQTLYRLVHDGRLRSFRVLNRSIRFDVDDLLELVEERHRRADYER